MSLQDYVDINPTDKAKKLVGEKTQSILDETGIGKFLDKLFPPKTSPPGYTNGTGKPILDDTFKEDEAPDYTRWILLAAGAAALILILKKTSGSREPAFYPYQARR